MHSAMSRVFDIPLLGGQNTIGREFNIANVGGLIYHRQAVRYILGIRSKVFHISCTERLKSHKQWVNISFA